MARKKKKGPMRYTKNRAPAQAGQGAGAAIQPAAPTPAAPVQASRHLSLTPLAPLIVRSGRPFDGQTGADAASFPPPSTVAGCLRTAWARAVGATFSVDLAAHTVAGPLLVRGAMPLLPKPADALYFGQGREACCVRASPRPFDVGCGADLPAGLLPVQLEEAVQGKPGAGPAWWAWPHWLAFRRGERIPHHALCAQGWSPAAGDRRTHVAIDPRTRAAADGKLFQTEGLDFADARWQDDSLRLLVRFAEPLPPAVVPLGGERRLAALQPEPESTWPQPPDDWFESILRHRGLTLTLVTPAVFAAGYRPGWLDADLLGVPPVTGAEGSEEAPPQLRLRAAAVERWEPHSGWDLARLQPRATRKRVPAGATYWFELVGEPGIDALRGLWLTSLCDDPQDRRDGFGLALPAPWKPPATPNAL